MHDQISICTNKKLFDISRALICTERFCDGESWRASYTCLFPYFKLIYWYGDTFSFEYEISIWTYSVWIIFISIDFLRHHIESIKRIYLYFFDRLTRNIEKETNTFTGATYYLIGCLIVMLLLGKPFLITSDNLIMSSSNCWISRSDQNLQRFSGGRTHFKQEK